MADQKISTLSPATALTGAELIEAVQGGNNVKVAMSAVLALPSFATQAPAAGTITDMALPGQADYVYDIDTTAGNVVIASVIPERDGQRVTYSNIGPNLLQIEFFAGSVGNQIRGSGGNATLEEDDSLTIQYCQEINSGQGAWVVI